MTKKLHIQSNFTKVPNSLIFSPNLSPNEKTILLILMSLDPCYPSRTRLEEWTGLSLTTVKNTLKSLKAKKCINWKSGNSRRKANEYRILRGALGQNTPQLLGQKLPRTRSPNDPPTRLIYNFDEYLATLSVDELNEYFEKQDSERPTADELDFDYSDYYASRSELYKSFGGREKYYQRFKPEKIKRPTG